jgi:hypothetical protein
MIRRPSKLVGIIFWIIGIVLAIIAITLKLLDNGFVLCYHISIIKTQPLEIRYDLTKKCICRAKQKLINSKHTERIKDGIQRI